MAYALSHVHSLIRGSVGGLTYLSNQFHQIVMRQRTAPVQPNTVWQAGIKSAFDYAESAWRNLSEAARDDWRFYALTCIYPGPAGPYTVPGRQLFIGTIALSKYTEGVEPGIHTVDIVAPVVSGWYDSGPVLPAAYRGLTWGIDLTVQFPVDRGGVLVVDRSIAFNPARTRYKGPWISPQKIAILYPAAALAEITIDLPQGTKDKAVFTRTRVFSAGLSPTHIPHAMAFPVILRHIVQEATGSPPAAAAKKAKAKAAE